jgi:hypothetical protein
MVLFYARHNAVFCMPVMPVTHIIKNGLLFNGIEISLLENEIQKFQFLALDTIKSRNAFSFAAFFISSG